MNDTIVKFKFPNTLIKEYKHWVILLRPAQVTIGSLVLACKSNAQSLSSMHLDVYTELKKVTHGIENTLKSLFNYDKINYLALMMVDKEVHFHVIPRYSNSIKFNGNEYTDKDWPTPPDVLNSLEISEKDFLLLKQTIKENWNDRER